MEDCYKSPVILEKFVQVPLRKENTMHYGVARQSFMLSSPLPPNQCSTKSNPLCCSRSVVLFWDFG
jgi:hypothetical protein